jgi:hypothetical protein
LSGKVATAAAGFEQKSHPTSLLLLLRLSGKVAPIALILFFQLSQKKR